MNVMICDPISPKGIALFQQRPEFKVTVLEKRLSEAELIPLVGEVEAMVVRSETKISRKVLEAAPKLRVVGRAGVGVDNVDVEAATQRGVVVMNTPGGNTVTTAELTFFMLGALARHIAPAHAAMTLGKWERKLFSGTEVHGKTLGVLGMGRIGSEVAKRALVFGMRVVAYDPFLSEARAGQLGVELMPDVDAVYRAADFITIHMLVTDQTRGMLNADAFAKMKPGVRIINAARGEIIVEKDLVAALESKKVAGAALDVFSKEPIPADHALVKLAAAQASPPASAVLSQMPNVLLLPHLGASTNEAQVKCGIEVAEIIAAYLLTGEVRNAVNLPFIDAKTYEQVQPYLNLGEKLGKLISQLAAQPIERVHVTYGGAAKSLPNIDPITRAILLGLLQAGTIKDVNNVNVRAAAAAHGITVEEKRSDEPVTFNEWLHVAVISAGGKKMSAGGTFFGSPNNPRIVRVFSQPTEIVPSGVVFMMNNKDRPGIVGHIGMLMARHQVNIASMSLSRDEVGGQAFTILNLDSVPPQALLDEIAKDADISNVRVVKL